MGHETSGQGGRISSGTQNDQNHDTISSTKTVLMTIHYSHSLLERAYQNRQKISFSISFPTSITVPLEIKGWVGFMCGSLFENTMARIPNHVFVVDDGSCFGCGACIALCPVDALSLDSLLAVVDEPNCVHCEHCIPACPVFALEIKPGD